ncbi:MAG: hypothetical protein CFE30_31475 [Bradyrhizobium sp. PARBB1]|nr:MAG: hypothetical protein CFE30_31475 [Bradyrhizobium sp. PARBB1]
MVGTRAWWVLTALGHPRVSILDGGLPRWRREDRPLTDAVTARAPTQFQPRLDPAMVADAERVARAMDNAGERLVNALSPEQFAGTGGAHYGRPGRIPGSVSVPAASLIDAKHKTFVPLEEAEATFAAQGITKDKRVIAYCGGGISATIDLFQLHRLGYDNLTLYDGSMGEWAKDAALPIEVG